MSKTESALAGITRGIAPYAIGGGLLVAAWLYRKQISDWISGFVGGFHDDMTNSWSRWFQQQTDVWKQAHADQMQFENLIGDPGKPTVADDIIAGKGKDEWIDAGNPYLPGWSMTVVAPGNGRVVAPGNAPVEPMDSVLGLQGIGLTETILQEISPTLMVVEREYNAPGVRTSETVFQDVWGGIIGPNLSAQSDPADVAACLASGGGWNWNDRRCSP